MSYEKSRQRNDDDSFEFSDQMIVEETQLSPTNNTDYDKDDNNEERSVRSIRVTKKKHNTRRKKVCSERNEPMVVEGFNAQSRHKNRLVSPNKKQRNDINFLTVELPDKYRTIEEKHNAIIQISANIDSYFPIHEINSQVQSNIRTIISHATHAYGVLNKEYKNREGSETKLQKLQEKIDHLEKELEKKNVELTIKNKLDQIVTEVEEELVSVISDLIWFVTPEKDIKKATGLYMPSYGPHDYNKNLSKICYHYIFVLSHKFVRKITNEITDKDMKKSENKARVWKYIWSKSSLGKNVYNELNQKRNSFVYTVKLALEIILASKGKNFENHMMMTLSKWISNPTICSEEFTILKNSLFVFISAAQSKNVSYHHNNLKNILHTQQDKDQNMLYFIPEIAKKFDGKKIVENLAIKDMALAYVAVANCLEFFILGENNFMNEEFEKQDNKKYNTTQFKDTDNLSVTDNVSTSKSDDAMNSTRSSTWNAQYRNKPKIFNSRHGIEKTDILRQAIDNECEIQVYTGGKKFTGGLSGSGHGWLWIGVERYEFARQKFSAEKDLIKGMHFECNTKTEDTTELYGIFNNEEVLDLDKSLNEGIDFDDMISSGLFASV